MNKTGHCSADVKETTSNAAPKVSIGPRLQIDKEDCHYVYRWAQYVELIAFLQLFSDLLLEYEYNLSQLRKYRNRDDSYSLIAHSLVNQRAANSIHEETTSMFQIFKVLHERLMKYTYQYIWMTKVFIIKNICLYGSFFACTRILIEKHF